MGTANGEGEKSAIEKSVEELIRATVGYARALFVLGLFPWRAARLVEGQRTVSGYVATFLFVSSFFLSVALGVLIDVLWNRGLDDLQETALKGVAGALHPNFGEALIALLPGIVWAHLVASMVARLLAKKTGIDTRVYQISCLAFSLHAFILAIVISTVLLLANALLGLILAEVLTPALLHTAYHRSLVDNLLDGLFTFGPFVVSIFLVLHFPAVAWFATRATQSRSAQPGRWKLFLVATIYPFAFAIYVASIALPHTLLTSLSPQTGKTLVLSIDTGLYSGDSPADVAVFLSNQTGRPIWLSRQRGFDLLFDDTQDGSPLLYSGVVVDWSGGAAPWMVIPANGSAWLIVRTVLPDGFCKRPGMYKKSAVRVRVVAKATMSGDTDHEGKTFESSDQLFCVLPKP